MYLANPWNASKPFQVAETIDDSVREAFSWGHCHALSIALFRRYGLPIRGMMLEDDTDLASHWGNVWDGMFLDIQGLLPIEHHFGSVEYETCNGYMLTAPIEDARVVEQLLQACLKSGFVFPNWEITNRVADQLIRQYS